MVVTPTTDWHVMLDLGEIDYCGEGNQPCEVEIGFTCLPSDIESRFAVEGFIWNAQRTDHVHVGYGAARLLLDEFFPKNTILRRAVYLAERWQNAKYMRISNADREEIIELMLEVEALERGASSALQLSDDVV